MTVENGGVIGDLAPQTPVVIRSADGLIVLTAVADSEGKISVDGLAPGNYTIESIDASGNKTFHTIQVRGRQEMGPDSLALTGSNPSFLFASACLLIITGGATVRLQRRRSTR